MVLLILTTAILLVLGFFNPRASLFWYSKERTTGLSSFIYGILLVLFIYMVPANKENAIETALHSQTIAADTVEAKMDTNTTVPTRVVEDPAKIEGERILRKLKARAERDWPNDYTTQEYWISNELEDYRYMLTIADGPIKRQAERDWPYDYTTQKYWYDQQIEARERLNR